MGTACLTARSVVLPSAEARPRPEVRPLGPHDHLIPI